MIVNVTSVDLVLEQAFTSVAVATGTDESGNVVRFGLDMRLADGLVHEVLLSGEVPCEVEDWQILTSNPAMHWIKGSGGFAACGETLSANLPSTTLNQLVTCPACMQSTGD
jgi:hypothetical protein